MFLEITYPIAEPDKYSLEKNFDQDLLIEFLQDYLVDQVGSGEDKRKAAELDEYRIRIDYDPRASDLGVFTTESDTGNRQLTAGIVAAVLRREYTFKTTGKR